MNNIYIFLSLLILNIFWTEESLSQIEFNLNESYYIEISTDTLIKKDGQIFNHIGGFSGIDQAGEKDHYHIISDAHRNNRSKGDAQYYEVIIKIEKNISIEFIKKNKVPVKKIWPESIRQSSNGTVYITEERFIKRKERSYLYQFTQNSEGKKIELPEKYQGEMYPNSGFESLCLSPDEQSLFLALERPMPAAADRYLTSILEINLENPDSPANEYFYPIQRKGKEKRKGNGITEILSLNDSILLVMERDYISPHNYVSLYTVNFADYNITTSGDDYITKGSKILKPHKVFTFDNIEKINGKDYKVNNLEGMTFSIDKNYLILISDNNFGNKCKCTPTQIVVLKIKI